MNVAMWVKALRVIPRIDKDEWNHLDVISKWLISTRAAVLIMTFSLGRDCWDIGLPAWCL